MPGITFADQPLLLVDAYGKLAEWIDRVMPLDDTFLFGSYPLATYNSSLPVPNYSPRPRMRVNTLYWPSGATRWACGLFLVAESQLNAIVEACQKPLGDPPRQQRQQTLVMDDGETKLSFEMFAMRPRQLNCTDLGGEKLWLLPLVDERWYWQWVLFAGGDLVSWEDLVGIGASSVLSNVPGDANFRQGRSKVLMSAVDPRYLIPDYTTFHTTLDNAAIMLDAIAWSIGQRVIRDFPPPIDGVVQRTIARLLSFDDSYIRLKGNLLDDKNLIAGDCNPRKIPGEFAALDEAVVGATLLSAAIPSNVLVLGAGSSSALVANVAYVSQVDDPGAFGARRVSLSEDYGSFRGQRVIRTTYVEGGPLGQNLLAAIATDYFKSKRVFYDLVYAGIKRWQPTGFDDFVLFEVGPRMPDGSLKIQTRVCSQPDNVEVDKQCSQKQACRCVSVPTAWTMTAEGIVDGPNCTSCSFFNGTFELNMYDDGTFAGAFKSCQAAWHTVEAGVCNASGGHDIFGDPLNFLNPYRWALRLTPTHLVLSTDVYRFGPVDTSSNGGAGAIYAIPLENFSCLGKNVLPLTQSFGTACTGWPQTITIEPAE